MTAFHGLHADWVEVWWSIFAALATAAFWVLLVVLVVAVIRRRPRGGARASSAVRVLEERYARGEISREEFLERRAVLSGQEPPA